MSTNNLPQIYRPKHQFTAADLRGSGHWVEDMIPVGGSVLLFGAAGVGKTTFAANLLNCVANSQQFLGRNTNPVNGMLLSLDTPKHIVLQRWHKNKPKPFVNDFHFVPWEPFDCLHPDFEKQPLYDYLQKDAKEQKIGLIVVDSLRDVFNGEMNNDDVPKQVYGIFQKWFREATVVFIHHSRKQQYANGKVVEGNIDDEATGSKYWVNKAQVSLKLETIRPDILKLRMGKSQCFAPWTDPIKMEMDGMNVKLWDSTTEAQYSQAYSAAETHCKQTDPQWLQLKERERDEAIAQHLGLGVSTVWRMKAAYRKQIP